MARSHIGSVVAFAAVLLVVGPAVAQTELRAASSQSVQREVTIAFQKFFIDAVNAQGKGQIQVRFLGGPEVMPPDRQAAATGRGALDITYCPASYYAGQVPEANLVVVSEMTAGEIRDSGAFQMLDALHQKKMNLKLVAWPDSSGAFNTYLSKKPIMAADGGISLKGYKLRSTATYRPLFEYLGATPVAMPTSDIFTGLQRGVIEGFGSPSAGLTAFGVKGLVKYRIDPTFYRLNNFVLMNLDKWNALPQATRDLVDAIAKRYEVESAKFYLDAAKAEEKELTGAGMEIITLAGKAATDYRAAANNAYIARITQQAGEATTKELLAKLRK